MTTKLQELVGYLAGRGGDPQILEELADPASDASLFLEATRSRSKALIQEPLPPESVSQPRVSRTGIGPVGWVGFGLALIAVGLAFRLVDTRLRRIEANNRIAETDARASADRIESAVDRLLESRPEPVSLDPLTSAIGRVEASLDRLDRRLQQLERSPEASKPDPIVSQLRDELANLRLEVATGEKLKVRKFEELQASIHELGRVLRLLLNRLDPPLPTTPEPPKTFQMPRS